MLVQACVCGCRTLCFSNRVGFDFNANTTTTFLTVAAISISSRSVVTSVRISEPSTGAISLYRSCVPSKQDPRKGTGLACPYGAGMKASAAFTSSDKKLLAFSVIHKPGIATGRTILGVTLNCKLSTGDSPQRRTQPTWWILLIHCSSVADRSLATIHDSPVTSSQCQPVDQRATNCHPQFTFGCGEFFPAQLCR